MIRLKRAYLFQEIKCGEGNRTEAVKTFTSDKNEQEYRGTMLKADITLDPDKGLLYIREHVTGNVHITTVNNLKSCIPFEADVPSVFVDEPVSIDVPLSTIPLKKRMGRPPKIKAEDASSSVA